MSVTTRAGRMPPELGERGTAALGLVHAITRGLEPIRHQLAHDGVVVDNQHVDTGFSGLVHFPIPSFPDCV